MEKLYDVVDVEIKDGFAIPPSKKLLPDSITTGVNGRGIDVLIVAQPRRACSERAKYEIDQYVMRGGRVLWVYDQQEVDENDFQQELGSTLSLDRNLNLDDMTQGYGFQVEHDLIQDLRSGQKPLMTYYDNRPRIVPMPYTMYPLVQDFGPSPVTRNLNAVMLRYASSIDTLSHPWARFAPLARTSPASRALSAPVYLNLDTLMNHKPPAQAFRGKGGLVTGLLVEGKFPSVFAGRPAPKDSLNPAPPTAKFLRQCVYDNKMIVLSDGALLRPTDRKSRFQGLMPYDNRKLLMNAVEFLMGESSLTKIRDKELVIHALDPKKVKRNEGVIRYGNILLPVLLVMLGGRAALLPPQTQKRKIPAKLMNATTRNTLLLAGALVLLVVVWLLVRKDETTLDAGETDFAVQDTAAVRQIKLTARQQDRDLFAARLTRQDGYWTVNDSARAKPSAVNQLMAVLHRMRVSEPVHENARDNVFKYIKEDHIKVEIEINEGEDKTFYVGGEAPVGPRHDGLHGRRGQPVPDRTPRLAGVPQAVFQRESLQPGEK